MRIAVIGSGISGHGAALALHGLSGISVTVFEQESRAGGHAHTLDLDVPSGPVAVDTGFIVYNDDNYSNFRRFLQWAGVATQKSDMSFALSLDGGAYEWAGCQTKPLSAFFAQRRNVVSPAHWRLLTEIVRFQRLAQRHAALGSVPGTTLETYLAQHDFSSRLRDHYVMPMGGAIWSMTHEDMLRFPAATFLNFFDNHKLLHWRRPQWRTVSGGSRSYVRRIAQVLGAHLVLNRRIARIVRTDNSVRLCDDSGGAQEFDRVIVATSAPQALALLDSPTPRETAVLGAFRVSTHRAVVHTDTSQMPKTRKAWASWNVLMRNEDNAATITYWMNRLQALRTDANIFVSINPYEAPRPDSVLATIDYTHPLYDAAAIEAQASLDSIQGPLVAFAGAWTRYGFHEDGLRSGLAAAKLWGGLEPWERQ
jgi:predicted NAD/FAD-binding protein